MNAAIDHPKKSRSVGILAGMGPAAGVDFVRMFVSACEDWMRAHDLPVCDQSYPEHWVSQLPVPDRSRALVDATAPQPIEALTRGFILLEALGASAVAIPCNTAHAWYADLQQRVPQVELLHIARETAADLRSQGIDRIALLATRGTYRTGLYETALAAQGIHCILPAEAARERLMQGIYEGVKAGNMALAQDCFTSVARELCKTHGNITMLMACTEIPLALPHAPEAKAWQLIDPAKVLARALACRAYG